MRTLVATLVVAASVLLAAQQAPQLPAPFATESAANAPRVVDPPAGAHLQVPQGFSADTWASGFDTPRFMLLAPGGEVLLSDSGAGVVYAFAGGKPAGAPVSVLTEFVNGLGEAQGRPAGVAFDRSGALLVADDVGNVVWRVTPEAAKPAP